MTKHSLCNKQLDPTTFINWLQILARVPNSILWLLNFPKDGAQNLAQWASNYAGPSVAARVIFTDPASKEQHILRARACDLFLDTPECNAHTTAADVLWASTPVLTLPRYEYKMCSRIGASCLRGALPRGPEGDALAQEMIATDELDYVNKAVELASGLVFVVHQAGQDEEDPWRGGSYAEGFGKLANLRRILFDNKRTCALFDTRGWVSNIERAYEEAWRRWVLGEGGDIWL